MGLSNRNVSAFRSSQKQLSGIKFLKEDKGTAEELLKLGEAYNSLEIGNKVYERLLPNIK